MITRQKRSTWPGWSRSILAMALTGFVVMICGCHEPRHSSGAMPRDGEELPIIDIVSGIHSHETLPMQVVIRDAPTLAQVPLIDVPVDFASQMLLVVTLGRVTSDQYGVTIERVWREGGRLRVKTTVQTPPPGVPVAMASPYCIAVVPRCDLNVSGFTTQPPRRTRSWEQSTPPENLGQ